MYSPITGTGDGSAPVVNLTFDYISKDHVKASVDGVVVALTWTGTSQVTFAAPVAAGADWVVYRETPISIPLVDFTNGSVLSEQDLDLSNQQLRYHQEEVDGRIDFTNTANEAAINAAASEAAAAASASQAATSETNANNSADAAAASQTAAAASQTAAANSASSALTSSSSAALAAASVTSIPSAHATAPDRATMAALNTAIPVFLKEIGREGMFSFVSGNLSASVAADPLQGIYVPPASDTTGASGAWVRSYIGPISALWFMSAAEVEDVQAFTYGVNVTTALRSASALIEHLVDGHLLLPPGGYRVGQQTRNAIGPDGVTVLAYAPSRIIKVNNAGNIKITLTGAKLKAEDGLYYGSFDPATGAVYNPPAGGFYDYAYYGSPYRGMIEVEGNKSVIIEDGELDGNSANMIIGGYFGDSYWQVEGHGIWAHGNDSYTEINVNSHDHPSDGRTVAYAGLTDASPVKPHILINPKGRYNGRLGMSLTGGNKVVIINPDFSQTGQTMNTSLGAKLQSTPGAGLDIEAEGSVIRNVEIINPHMIGNWRPSLVAASGDSRDIIVRGGKVEGVVLGRYAVTLDEVTMLGHFDIATPLTNDYLPGTPATTRKDGHTLRNCFISYDATLTEDGVLQDASQALLTNAFWLTAIGNTFDSGAVLLPDAFISPLADHSIIWEDNTFETTNPDAVTGNGITGYFRGVNNITTGAGGLVVMQLGTASRIETGTVFVNGTAQGIPYDVQAAIDASGGGALADGDYGDVSVSGSGAAMNVEGGHPTGSSFTITGPAATDLNLTLNGAQNHLKGVAIQYGGLSRWFAGDDGTGEGGSNSGSPFAIIAYDDAGGFLGYAMTITRATRDTSFGGNVNVASGKVFKVNGTQVVGAQQTAIADDASGAANQATVNAILAAMRAHGLIA
jgi:hypothetical protein